MWLEATTSDKRIQNLYTISSTYNLVLRVRAIWFSMNLAEIKILASHWALKGCKLLSKNYEQRSRSNKVAPKNASKHEYVNMMWHFYLFTLNLYRSAESAWLWKVIQSPLLMMSQFVFAFYAVLNDALHFLLNSKQLFFAPYFSAILRFTLRCKSSTLS